MKQIATIIFLAAIYAALTFPYWQKQVQHELRENPPQTLPVSGQEKIEPNTLIIPSLGIRVPIVEVSEASERAFQEGLKTGVVHYPDTARVGEFGNPYIFGHSSDYIWAEGKFKTAFATLPKINKGDEIIASNSSGDKFVYKVIETLVASPRNIELLDQHDYEKKLLTLQTSYPLGTALKRFIAIAELLELK